MKWNGITELSWLNAEIETVNWTSWILGMKWNETANQGRKEWAADWTEFKCLKFSQLPQRSNLNLNEWLIDSINLNSEFNECCNLMNWFVGIDELNWISLPLMKLSEIQSIKSIIKWHSLIQFAFWFSINLFKNKIDLKLLL